MTSDNKRMVLIVEDEQALLDSYAEIAQTGDMECLKAGDGYKALEQLEGNKGEVDVVLLDLMMPGMDGLEVLRSVRADEEKYGDMPIIILTAMTSERVIKEAFDLGASSYLIKTELEVEDLLKEVNKVLGTE